METDPPARGSLPGRIVDLALCHPSATLAVWAMALAFALPGIARLELRTDGHALVPPGAPHTFANPGDEPAIMLCTFTPDLYVQYFRDLKAMMESGQPMTPDSVAAVWTRYATEPSTEYAS